MSELLTRRMECYFAIFGAVVGSSLLFLAAFLTPGYDPRFNTISSLGEGVAKSLFSIAFVLYGSLAIPFFVFLEREFVNVKEIIRKLATGVSIFTSVCIAMVGIIPDETYPQLFIIFHLFAAGVAFVGSSIYIILYSVLMYYSPKSKMYKDYKFKKLIVYFGFGVIIPLALLLITLQPIIEWLLFIYIYLWLISTAYTSLKYRFFNIEGVYYKKSQYDDALEKFNKSLEILDNLNLGDHAIADTLKENIEFIKKEQKKQEQMKEYIDFWKR